MQTISLDEKRQFQRIQLRIPILARLNRVAVEIVDIGMLGARVRHDEPVPSRSTVVLSFLWRGAWVNLEGAVRYSDCRPGEEGFLTGVQFYYADGTVESALKTMLFELARRELELVRVTDLLVLTEVEKRAHESAPYLQMRFNGCAWQRMPRFVWKQPTDGFTVPRNLHEGEIQRMCFAYTLGDQDAQSLVRLLAELNIMRERRLLQLRSVCND